MWQIEPAGDRALLVTVVAVIDPRLLGEVLALVRALAALAPDGLIGTVPAYGSLLCRYDPDRTTGERLTETVQRLEGTLDAAIPAGALVEVPVRYDGPDLDAVSSSTGLTTSGVIELHAGEEYLVFCVGFAPGFTYCGVLPEQLSVQRLASPRTQVPAGSVGIAGRQTGIYAVESPGGWNLIGRTTMSLFDASHDVPVRFKPGDRIRFVPTS